MVFHQFNFHVIILIKIKNQNNIGWLSGNEVSSGGSRMRHTSAN